MVIRGRNEGLKFFGPRNKRRRMSGRGRRMTKSMCIDVTSNAGDERMQGGGVVLDSRSVVVGVQKGLEKSASR